MDADCVTNLADWGVGHPLIKTEIHLGGERLDQAEGKQQEK